MVFKWSFYIAPPDPTCCTAIVGTIVAAMHPAPEKPEHGLTVFVAAPLKQLIYSGEHQPGERLNEAALALRMGTSRGPVREMLELPVQCRAPHCVRSHRQRHPGQGQNDRRATRAQRARAAAAQHRQRHAAGRAMNTQVLRHP